MNQDSIIQIQNVQKTYEDGFQALKDINLDIKKGEIFALLGPNGAGKTTLISIICGLVNLTGGTIHVAGHDVIKDYKRARSMIGLVPQELTTDAFEKVWNTIQFSRGLFGKPKDNQYLEKVLKDLSLWEKRNNRLITLSGGMKRRVLIAKALSHEPQVLFLDEPTAGVDVELRKSMWDMVRKLRETGVTVILTTHYIEEAEEMADRIGVINHGHLILVEEKQKLMKKLGVKELVIDLKEPLARMPASLSSYNLKFGSQQDRLIYSFDTADPDNRIAELLEELNASGIKCQDIHTKQSSLEDIFVRLVNNS